MTDVELRAHAIHQSGVKELTDGCSWRWRLKHVDQLDDPPTWDPVIGTAVHAGIELYMQAAAAAARGDRTVSAPTLDDMVRAGHRALDVEAGRVRHVTYGDDRPNTLLGARRAVEVGLGHWWSAPIPAGQPGAGASLRDRVDGFRPVAVEPHFRVWRAPHSQPLGGWIDLAVMDGDTPLLVDYKTCRKYGRWPLDGTVTRLQPSLYALASRLATTLPFWSLPEFEFHITRTNEGSKSSFEAVRVIRLTLDDLDVSWIDSKVSEADRIVSEGDFTPNTDYALCSKTWCSFHTAPGSPCPARPEGWEG